MFPSSFGGLFEFRRMRKENQNRPPRLLSYSFGFNLYQLPILQPILLWCFTYIDCSSSSNNFNCFTAKYLNCRDDHRHHASCLSISCILHLQKRWRITREVRVFLSSNVEIGQRVLLLLLHHIRQFYMILFNKAFSAGLQNFWCPVYCIHGARISNDLLRIRLSSIDFLSYFLSYLF
jgi:hypothetical protein